VKHCDTGMLKNLLISDFNIQTPPLGLKLILYKIGSHFLELSGSKEYEGRLDEVPGIFITDETVRWRY